MSERFVLWKRLTKTTLSKVRLNLNVHIFGRFARCNNQMLWVSLEDCFLYRWFPRFLIDVYPINWRKMNKLDDHFLQIGGKTPTTSCAWGESFDFCPEFYDLVD